MTQQDINEMNEVAFELHYAKVKRNERRKRALKDKDASKQH
jgi:trehalose-6-phosphatase